MSKEKIIQHREEREKELRAETLRKKLKGKDYMGNYFEDSYVAKEETGVKVPSSYNTHIPKEKDISYNQAFSSKDLNLINQLQNNYKTHSEGNFKTSSQNLYTSLESPLVFRGMSAAFKQQGVPTAAAMSLKMGDRRAAQKAQELQNWSTKMSVVTDAVAAVGSVASAIPGVSDRRLKKDIKLIGLSPSGLKIYSFKYKDNKYGKGTYQGVMSNEIPAHAVIKDADGYDRVNYSTLDVEFKEI